MVIKAEAASQAVTGASGVLNILRGIHLEIKAGESVAIVGASGSGKSTLLGLLAGLDVPTEGRIWLGGHELTAMDEDRRAALRAKLVGFVFQSFQLLPSLSAVENVMLPLELAGRSNARKMAERYLERVGLAARARHTPRQLSGGEQQRVAIARAFAAEPRVLFADEPTGNLDSATGERVIELLFELNRNTDTTLMLVTHEQRLAQRCARQLTLAAGEIIADTGHRAAVTGSPATLAVGTP